MSSSINVLRSYYSSFNPRLNAFTVEVLSLSLKQRSAIIKCCQAQYVPQRTENTTLQRIVEDAPPLYTFRNGIYGSIHSLYDLLGDYSDFIISSATCHLILDICRSAPLQLEEVNLARLGGWSKEISVLEGDPVPETINWRAVMDPNYGHESLLPDLIPPKTGINRLIRFSLNQWVMSTCSQVHYNRASAKQISYSTIRDLEDHGYQFPGKGIVSQQDLERIYMETGYKAGGICEVRQKWYRANAKPRTYYAQGGETYFNSAPLQDAFTSLHDAFPFTHRKLRLAPTRLVLKAGNRFRVYDFETFTSRLDTQQSFCRELAKLGEGHTFLHWDARDGLLESDFGDILSTYAETCTRGVKVSYERITKEFSEHVSHHAGLLGIFGNLMTSTVAHGLVVRYLCDNDEELNIAGDDGLAPENDESEISLFLTLEKLGKVEMSKTFRSDEAGCIHLKRPFRTLDSLITTGQQILYPSASRIVYLLTGDLDIRYVEYDDEICFEQTRHKRIASEVGRFSRHVHAMSSLLSEQAAEDICGFFRWISKRMNMPMEGRLYGDFWPWLPQTPEELYVIHPVQKLLDIHYSGVTEQPKMGVGPEWTDFHIGYTGEHNMTRHMSWLKRLGLISAEPVMETYFDEIGYNILFHVLTSHTLGDILYNVTVLRDIPIVLL